MISYEEALRKVLEKAKTGGRVQKLISDTTGLVLAENVVSKYSIPFSDNSAMDGFAVRFEDISGATDTNPAKLKIIGEASAGSVFKGAVTPGTAVSIFTGAVIPEGADTVVEKEVTLVQGNEVLVFEERKKGANIRLAGEDVQAGSTVFEAGTVIAPSVAGVLASIGRSKVFVYREPVIAIISTGSELIDIDEDPYPGAVRNSNTYLLEALLKSFPSKVVNFGTVKDSLKDIKDSIEQALSVSDIVLTTGGVSVGDYDFVKKALEEAGATQIFWKVAQKPGKPLAFYELGDKVIFGLPGNPAAVHICFLEYVRPYILKFLGRKDFLPLELDAKLLDGHRKKPGRLNFVRVSVRLENGEYVAQKAGAQGSGVLSTSTRANAIALIPAEITEVMPGERVKIHYFGDLM